MSQTRSTSTGVTFPVSDVAPAVEPLGEVAYKEAVENLLRAPPSDAPEQYRPSVDPNAPKFRPVEACSRYHGRLVAGGPLHPVVAAVHHAFCDHRPLVFTPDVVWLMVAQGFANHVNANAERLRSRFVRHAGRATIRVQRDDFVKGSPENPWPEVFAAFSAGVREHVGDATHDLLLPNFSTTGPTERAAAEIVLLDAMQSYFKYEFMSLCGIPRVTLEGTPDDWRAIAARTRALERFDLGWWTSALAPILDEFVAAAEGRVDAGFWRSIYKHSSRSGGVHISGWISAFFPYLEDYESGLATHRHPWLAKGGRAWDSLRRVESLDEDERGDGPTTESLPGGLARAPFVWRHRDASYAMEFLGGFVGVRQDAATLSLRPEIGWAVRDAPDE